MTLPILKIDIEKYQPQCCTRCLLIPAPAADVKLTAINFIDGEFKENCDAKYNLSCLLNQTQEKSNKIDLVENEKGECLIQLKLSYNGITSCLPGYLDTGSVADVISISTLREIFPNQNFSYNPPHFNLVSVESAQLNCFGVVSIECTIANITLDICFHVIDKGHVCLLGMHSIRRFKITIAPHLEQCFINSISSEFDNSTECEMMGFVYPAQTSYVKMGFLETIEFCFNNVLSMKKYQYLFSKI